MWRWFVVLVVLVGLLTGLAAGMLNPQPLVLDLFLFQFDAPLGVLVIGVFTCGVLVGGLFAVLLGMTRRARRRSQSTPVETGKALSSGHD